MEYVCPSCGTPARGASRCTTCGLDLDAVAHLPTAEEFEAGGQEAVARAAAQTRQASAGQPGGLLRRAGAGFVDGVVVVAASIVVALVIAVATQDNEAGTTAATLVYLLMLVAYPPAMLALNGGRTLGKQALELKVQRRDGARVGFGRAFLREIVVKTLLGVTIVGTVADAIVAATNHQRHSLHDKLLDTEVVTTASRS